jgi:hypothetical protein
MSPWILIPCLVRLRTEFDVIAPARDRKSDGSMGDTAHAGAGTSDHLPDEDFAKLRAKDPDRTNEVHAIDVDDDLRTAGLSMETVVQFLVGRCRAGTEQRLRYIIHNRRIWEASNGWRQRAYTGENAHTEHAHFSASYESAHEMSTASWHLEDLIRKEEPMATQFNADDKAELVIAAKAPTVLTNWPAGGGQKSDVGNGVLNAGIPDSLTPGTLRVPLWTVIAGLMDEVKALRTEVGLLGGSLAAIGSGVNSLMEDPADVGASQQIVACVRYYHEEVAPPAP